MVIYDTMTTETIVLDEAVCPTTNPKDDYYISQDGRTIMAREIADPDGVK